MNSQKEIMMLLELDKAQYTETFIYIAINMSIYIIQIVFDIYGVFKVTLDNHISLRRFSFLVNGVAIMLSIWALFVVKA